MNADKVLFTILILIECMWVGITFWKLFKKSIFCSLFYSILFYFCLVFEVRYLYFPESLLDDPYVVYGFFDAVNKYWLNFYIFTSLSLLLTWIIIWFGLRNVKQWKNVRILKSHRQGSNILCLACSVIYLIYAIIELYFLIANFSNISYSNSLNSSSINNFGSYYITQLLITGSAYYIGPMIVLLFDKQLGNRKTRRIIYLAIIISSCVLVSYSIFSGDRTLLFSVFFGLVSTYLYVKKISLIKIFKMGMGVIAGYSILTILITVFSRRMMSDISLQSIFFPYGMAGNMFDTFAVIRYGYIDPVEVVVSTITKIFMFNDYPYLFITIGDLFATFTVNSTSSFAHFLFADGFVFAGYFGFLYNGIVIGCFVLVWDKLSRSNDYQYNKLAICATSTLILPLIRGAGMSCMMKYLYQYMIPITIIYLVLSRKKIVIVKKRGN